MSVSNRITRRSARRRLRLRVTTSQGRSYTVNVSTGGFCSEPARMPAVGDPVEGLICLNGRDFSFAGRVVWTRPGDSRPAVRGRMGVRFVRIDTDFAPGVAARERPASPCGI